MKNKFQGLRLPTIQALAYPREKALAEKRNNPASYYVYRPMSWPFVWIGLTLGIGPTQVTGGCLLLAIAGIVLLSSGHYAWGAVCLNLAYILDQVDGNIARATGNTSRRGAWLDSLVGFLYGSFTLAALGLGLFFDQHAGRSIPILVQETFRVSPKALLVLGILGSAAIVTRKMAVAMIGDIERTDKTAIRNELDKQGGIARIPKAINSFAILLLLLASIAGMQGGYLILYSAYQVLLMLAVCVSTFRRFH